MTIVSIIGLAAAVLTTGAYVPQAYKTIKTRSTGGLSLITFSMLVLGTALWFVYGLYLNDLAMILANGITTALAGTILFLKITSKPDKNK